MRFRLLLATTVLLLPVPNACAQWALQDANVTADMRGIDYVGGGVAWASGSHGTVLRTEDTGHTWQLCATPPDAKDLDFRGVQAFDNKTAVVMSSGPGDKSRLYKTTDGCRTWKEVFRDPDETGFFDSLLHVGSQQLFLLGDPVGAKFAMFTSRDSGDTWYIADDPGLDAGKGLGAFAASNSALGHVGPYLMFGAGGPAAEAYVAGMRCDKASGTCATQWQAHPVPLAHGPAGAGVFSIGGRLNIDASGHSQRLLLVMGGQYDQPGTAAGTAAFSGDGGETWTASRSLPAGYRSALGYDVKKIRWIAVGPNGTDVSTDDGRNWLPLKPGPGDAPDADKNWNALSLPFAVGPKGRVGILRDAALKPVAK